MNQNDEELLRQAELIEQNRDFTEWYEILKLRSRAKSSEAKDKINAKAVRLYRLEEIFSELL